MNDLLKQGASALGIPLSEEQLQKFKDYYELLLFWNRSVNLTTITDEVEVVQKHFIDSLAYVKAFPTDYRNLRFLDIGSGAGFPGVPLKIAFPALDIHLMEPSYKRTSFLHTLNSKLHLNVRVIEDKAEVWLKKNEENFDLMMMRAVGHIDNFVKQIFDNLNHHGRIIISSGPRPFDFRNVDQRRVETFSFLLPIASIQRSFLIVFKD